MHVQSVVPQYIGDASNGRISQQHVTNRKVHREIENRRKSAVDAVVTFHSTHEKRSYARIGMKHLADCREVRIQPPQSRMPRRPEFAPHVRERIHTVAVQPGCLRPPDSSSAADTARPSDSPYLS